MNYKKLPPKLEEQKMINKLKIRAKTMKTWGPN